jgi:hypothetical protein
VHSAGSFVRCRYLAADEAKTGIGREVPEDAEMELFLELT